MRLIKALFLLVAAPAFAATSVSQYGITWEWEEDLTVGQYANGDYYVVAPDGLTMTSITPASTYTQTSSSEVTITQASPCVVTWASHGLRPGQIIRFSTTGSLPSGLTAGTWYYVGAGGLTTDTFRVSTIPWPANTYVATSSAGSGTHTCEYGRVINGTMANPKAGVGVYLGFDSSLTSNKGASAVFSYSVDLNVARPNGDDLSVGNPLEVPPGTSLVSSISNSTPQNRPQLTDAAVLTVVSSAPDANSMRPPYCGTDKTHYWNADDLDYPILKDYLPVAGTPDLADVEDYLERPWIEIETNTTGREAHPSNNQPNYGREIAHQINAVGLSLNLNYSDAEKELSYIRLTQYGIDVYGAAVTGGDWIANGGHNIGRKMPLLLAAKAFNDASLLAYANATSHFIFQEDQQTFFVDQDSVDITNGVSGPAWSPNTAESAGTATISNASPAVVTRNNLNLRVNSIVSFTTTGTMPTGVSPSTTYYVIADGLTANSFQISATRGGAAINTSSDGSGTITMRYAIPYESGDIGLPEWGIEHSNEPENDNYAWNATYRGINNGAYLGAALTTIFLASEADWNWAPFFDYTDRAVATYSAPNADVSAFELNMWQTYRNGEPSYPYVTSATINAAGTSLTIVWSESCTNGAGGGNGVTLSSTSGAVTATYSAGSGSDTYTYTVSPSIKQGAVVTVSYTQGGTGILATVGSVPVESFSSLPVTNDSTAQFPAAMSNGSPQRLFPGGGF